MRQPVYLWDFSVYKPPEEYRLDVAAAKKNAAKWSMYKQDNADFQIKVAEKSGLNTDGTYLPPAVNPAIAAEPKSDMKTAMLEAEMVMGGAVSDLLEKTGIRPEDVDILISNCSIFCPTPSLGSMLINKFKFRKDIQAYHLGGMGCAIGVVAIGLVRDMLQAHPNSIALFVPAEITTYAFYPGAQPDFLVANAIFRMGGAAALFTNKASLRSRCKYQLQHSVRVHTGQDDAAYECISWGPDEAGINGVHLSKDVPGQAVKMLDAVITAITPRIMTWGQYAEAAKWLFEKRFLGSTRRYVPDYSACVDHFALHAGGYAVLKGMMKGMGLTQDAVLPSFATLRDYGNTSSSTTWYTMAYLESQSFVKRGHRIMQVGAGGGMKGAVNIWRALRDTHTVHPAWRHVAGRPYRDEDLPRRINEQRKPVAANGKVEAGARSDAAAPGRDQDSKQRLAEPATPPQEEEAAVKRAALGNTAAITAEMLEESDELGAAAL